MWYDVGPMITRRAFTLAAASLAVLTLAASGCTKTSDEIVVGAYLSLSGSDSTFGTDTKDGIELAADQGRLEEYRRVSTFNRHCGVDVEELSPREVADMFQIGARSMTNTPLLKNPKQFDLHCR